MSPDLLIRAFDGRSFRLRIEAYGFLIVAVILLGFAAYIIFQAPALTTSDIAHSLDDRLTQVEKEIGDVTTEYQQINLASADGFGKCANELIDLFQRWESKGGSDKQSDDKVWHPVQIGDQIPSGLEIAKAISDIVGDPSVSGMKYLGVQLMISQCGANHFFVMPPADYGPLLAALSTFQFKTIDRERLNMLWSRRAELEQRRDFLIRVRNAINDRKVEAAAGVSDFSQKDDTIVRLVQTSITRFGVLAVISFLVGLIVSLYRYNMRLAAFYLARADLLRMKDSDLSPTDFALLATALTPQVEFGKSPPSPINQILGMVGAAKGFEK